jgi:hypothetical protein
MNQQRKTERYGAVPMRDDTGREYPVTSEADFMREQFQDGTWSEWMRTRVRFKIGGEPVNRLDDGWFEIASSRTRIRP